MVDRFEPEEPEKEQHDRNYAAVDFGRCRWNKTRAHGRGAHLQHSVAECEQVASLAQIREQRLNHGSCGWRGCNEPANEEVRRNLVAPAVLASRWTGMSSLSACCAAKSRRTSEDLRIYATAASFCATRCQRLANVPANQESTGHE